MGVIQFAIVFFSSRRRHTRCLSDWSSDVCSSDLDERMRVVDIVGIGGILAWPYEEWLNGARGAVGIHNLLGKAGGCGSGITVESLSARESPEIRIERAILLVQHEDVLDVLLNQADKLRVGQTWFNRTSSTSSC